MLKHVLLAGAPLALAASAACSTEPQATPGAQPAGPQGPQPSAAARPVPKDAPLDPAVRNVPATTGRGNVAESPRPFAVEEIGRFDQPFAIAFLPDGGLLVTEKGGKLKVRGANGSIVDVAGVPAVQAGGQGGLLDVAVAPDYASSKRIYLSYGEPGAAGPALALARATLDLSAAPVLKGPEVIWRSGSNGPGGQFGAAIAFAPDGKSLFLASGERQRFTPAQDPEQALGKILHLTLDGKPAADNPMLARGGVQAMTWSSGHRNPYGLVFAPDGRLWEVEMGPRGGDEVNLIEPGRNYGWPLVSNGDNYSGQPIPDHPSRPEFAPPKVWWNPVISPGGMMMYSGAMFPQYRGSLLIAGLSSQALIRVAVNGTQAQAADQWAMGTRIRDVAQAPDGAIWVLEDGEKGAGGRLLRLTPKR